MLLCEADTQDVCLRPGGSSCGSQQLALHGPQVKQRTHTGHNLTLGQSRKVLMLKRVHKRVHKTSKTQRGYAHCQQRGSSLPYAVG